MNRNQAKELLPIIKAFSEGKDVETKTGSGWISIENMSFAGNPDSYRIQARTKVQSIQGCRRMLARNAETSAVWVAIIPKW